MKITKVGNGVYHAQGYSHHTMIVEFPQWLALMDAPYTATQTKALWQAIQEQFPAKPVKYVAVSHHHFDHIGGVREAAAMGATILVEKAHEPILRPLLEARHTQPPDELDKRRNAQPPQTVGAIEIYEGKKVISEGGQSFELYPIAGSPHVDPMVLGYAASARALFNRICIRLLRLCPEVRSPCICCNRLRRSTCGWTRWSADTAAQVRGRTS